MQTTQSAEKWVYIDSYGGYTVADKHSEQQKLKKSCRQAKWAAISEKIEADRYIGVANSDKTVTDRQTSYN